MKDYILEGEALKVPTSWSDVSFEKYIQIKSGHYKTDAQIISLFTGVEEEKIRTIKVGEAYNLLIRDLLFIEKDLDPDFIPPNSIEIHNVQYKLPLDIGTETVGQYSDLKDLVDSNGLEAYAKAVAIYLQPKIDGTYNYSKAKELVQKVYTLPCDFVFGMGGFFLENAYGSSSLFMTSYRKLLLPQTKFKRAIKSFQINTAFYLRYVIWPKIRGLLKIRSYNGQ